MWQVGLVELVGNEMERLDARNPPGTETHTDGVPIQLFYQIGLILCPRHVVGLRTKDISHAIFLKLGTVGQDRKLMRSSSLSFGCV